MVQGILQLRSLVFRPKAFVRYTFTSVYRKKRTLKLCHQCPCGMPLGGSPSKAQKHRVFISRRLLFNRKLVLKEVEFRVGGVASGNPCDPNLLILRCKIPTASKDSCLTLEPVPPSEWMTFCAKSFLFAILLNSKDLEHFPAKFLYFWQWFSTSAEKLAGPGSFTTPHTQVNYSRISGNLWNPDIRKVYHVTL